MTIQPINVRIKDNAGIRTLKNMDIALETIESSDPCTT